jgi:hypothetical protein
MDEMWQRHKSFILQIVVGGIVFLVAFFIMRSMYGDEQDPARVEKKNRDRLAALQSKVTAGEAPSTSVIAEQKSVAARAESLKWELASRVASTAGRDQKKDADRDRAYVGESIRSTLESIGRPDDGAILGQYDRLPQTGLSTLTAAARAVLAGKAAQSGKLIDEALGVTSFQTDEIPSALHGLSIVVDVVGRCLARDGIDRVENIRITPRSSFPEANDVAFVNAIGVHFEVRGDPNDVNELIRSFNAVARQGRMIVLESIEYVQPINPDEDTVKAAINVVGLRYKSETKSEGQ